ncbi:MAG: ECF-type sigma factor [Thermoanaerobaculia bacterium]
MPNETVTALLVAAREDEPRLVDELVPLVYKELRMLAHRLLANEARGGTLDTTGLVHEAYLKLVGSQEIPARGRAYFFGAATRAMRQVLVDAARRRRRQIRGGGVRPVPLGDLELEAPSLDSDLVAVDEALTAFAGDFPRQAQVVEFRFFGGLSVEETAAALQLSPRTVKRDWSFAQAWLYRTLAPDQP